MRSRFVAFGFSNFDYIDETQVSPLEQEVRDRQAPEWESLKILRCEAGGKDDETGIVEFIAHYRLDERRRHHEVSRFVRRDGKWCYQDGDIDDAQAPENSSTKIGRNDPCPCGSGRKYKRCCGV